MPQLLLLLKRVSCQGLSHGVEITDFHQLAEKKAQEALVKAKEEAEAAAAKANEEADAAAKVLIAKAAAEARAEASAAGSPYIPRKSQRASLSSSSPKAAIGSLQSEGTSDDEESEMVTPEMARKIVNDLLAEYTTLHV